MITATDQPATRDPSRGYSGFEKKKKCTCDVCEGQITDWGWGKTTPRNPEINMNSLSGF